jgi:hypothetical protein
VKGLVDDQGVRHEDMQTMGAMVKEYFEKLFTSEVMEIDDEILDDVDRKVSVEMNQLLLAPFSKEEVKKALFSIGDLKAPGPDGLHAIFFKRFWHLLEDDLVEEVLGAIQRAEVPVGWNDATIVMIPKVDNPDKVTQFRPISLCNVVYKVVSKCLVNRLRPVLDEVVSEEQSASIQGRMITDNALLAFEYFHAIQKNKVADKAACAYKLDLSKAYDRVDWQFLEMAMNRLGFAHRWVRWIMSCVTSVRYSVKFNGTLLRSFIPSRGLRQGDPLSPFLFLFVADGLSLLLKEKVEQNILTPIKICRNAPSISHLLYADDTLLC